MVQPNPRAAEIAGTVLTADIEDTNFSIVKNEGSDWLTKARDSAINAHVQAKNGDLFSHFSETDTKFCSNQFASRPVQLAAQPTDRILQ